MRTPDETKASEGGNPTDLLARTPAEETGFTQVITTSISGEEFTTDATDVARDSLRRQIRAELHAARCRDKDHDWPRYRADARELDRRMTEAGFPPIWATTWSRGNATEACAEAIRSDDRASGEGQV